MPLGIMSVIDVNTKPAETDVFPISNVISHLAYRKYADMKTNEDIQ